MVVELFYISLFFLLIFSFVILLNFLYYNNQIISKKFLFLNLLEILFFGVYIFSKILKNNIPLILLFLLFLFGLFSLCEFYLLLIPQNEVYFFQKQVTPEIIKITYYRNKSGNYYPILEFYSRYKVIPYSKLEKLKNNLDIMYKLSNTIFLILYFPEILFFGIYPKNSMGSLLSVLTLFFVFLKYKYLKEILQKDIIFLKNLLNDKRTIIDRFIHQEILEYIDINNKYDVSFLNKIRNKLLKIFKVENVK